LLYSIDLVLGYFVPLNWLLLASGAYFVVGFFHVYMDRRKITWFARVAYFLAFYLLASLPLGRPVEDPVAIIYLILCELFLSFTRV